MSPNKVPTTLDPERVRQGATVRTLRELRGLKVGELASVIDVSYAYLSNIEAGRKRLTPQLTARIADALKVSQGAIVSPEHFEATGVAS